MGRGGRRNPGRPRRGSLAFSPRKRASRPVARIRSWPDEEQVRMQGFAGYKAGMTHVVMIDDWPNSPTEGEEITVPVTVLDCPPMFVCAVRGYAPTPDGYKCVTEVWAELPDDLEMDRVFTVPDGEAGDPETLEEMVDDGTIEEIRVIVATQPKKAGVPKKKPDVMEYRIGGSDVRERFDHAMELLGEEVRVGDVFEEGELVDVAAITKGKGFQGVVKRWGVTIQDRKAQRKQKGRHVGSIGPITPARTRWTVPMAGQMGYHQRTEYNKRILKIGEDGSEVTPEGGFVNYGIVRGDYVLLHGTVPGPKKRLIRMRPAIRPPKNVPSGAPEITYISRTSQQGNRPKASEDTIREQLGEHIGFEAMH
ncbi:MAG: 50S ribosomal protein L3 [Methanopyri archaeon]|nr:50S ribosomal protein L3 [Methanopyri archaeon]